MAGAFAEKTILLGVCGSIAAYKACDLASRLVERGATVVTALTRAAQQLVQPASFEAITGNRVITDMFAPVPDPEIEHIAMAQRADLFLIAPATANMLAKAAHGICDDWLSTTLLATRAPILFAPAMNTAMYTHAATQTNLALLRDRGTRFVGPASGRLACGSEGPGRLADIPDILDAAAAAAHQSRDYAGKRVLITSGPNHEPVDPVRYLGNRSSGKMGRALALEALCRGAEVCVVSGPAEVAPPYGASVVAVTTAHEMHQAVMDRAAQYDVIVGAAAVADYHVADAALEKIKRNAANMALTLAPNPDIIADVAARKRPDQRVVGFAAETRDALENAQEKMARKGLDMIVANRVGGDRCAIGAEHGDAWILMPNRAPEQLPNAKKTAIARRIFDLLSARE